MFYTTHFHRPHRPDRPTSRGGRLDDLDDKNQTQIIPNGSGGGTEIKRKNPVLDTADN
jgi:hypothetical protein